MIEVVFFDAGETLLRPEPSFPGLVAAVLAQRGHEVSEETVIAGARAVSGHFRRAAEEGNVHSASADASRLFWTTLYAEMLEHLGIDDPEGPAELYRVFSDPANYGLFDDTIPTLLELRQRGLRLGVISNFEGWLAELLERLGLADLFEVVAISGPLGMEKPDPRFFKWAVEEAGVEPAVCAHVGDQPFFDADAAEACGLRAVLLDRHGRWGDEERPYPVIAGLDELPDVLEGMR